MALSLVLNNQLLVADGANGSADVLLANDTVVPIAIHMRHIPPGGRFRITSGTNYMKSLRHRTELYVKFGDLPTVAQRWYTKQIDSAHKKLLADTPEREVIRGSGLIPTKIVNGRVVRVFTPTRYRDVPRPVKPTITDETKVIILPSVSFNGNPALAIDKPLVIRMSNRAFHDQNNPKYALGAIVGFTLASPASR